MLKSPNDDVPEWNRVKHPISYETTLPYSISSLLLADYSYLTKENL